MKRCYICKEIKLQSEFHRDRSRSTGISGRCKSCNTDHCAKYAQSREKHRTYELKYYYGLTEAQYTEIATAQGGVCKICKTKPERVLAVDHDAKTKRVRGLLCRRCNSAIGLLDHVPERMDAAAEYMRCT